MTKIEWCDVTINPVKGLCPMACPYCYARRMYKRFKWNPEIRLVPLLDVHVPEGSKIFVGSTIELFGSWVKIEWLEYIFKWVKAHPQHTFIFLTKWPQNLLRWSPFPENCWVGVSTTTNQQYRDALVGLAHIQATVKFLSLEPLLENIKVNRFDSFINWVIIGAQTPYSPKTSPKIEWIDEIVFACDRSRIPVFIKNNLKPLLAKDGYVRQEFPNA